MFSLTVAEKKQGCVLNIVCSILFHFIYPILRRKRRLLLLQICKTNIAGALEMHSSITIDSDCIEMLMQKANGFFSWLLESATSKECYSAERCPVFRRVQRHSDGADIMLTCSFQPFSLFVLMISFLHCPGLSYSLLFAL